jgi:16S rRNA (guanine966-N2)-methyltransferase
VRETLFNWLMPKLGGAGVLDLFAGSGALGLEAVSRGAAHATLVERDAQLGRNLTAAVAKLQAAATRSASCRPMPCAGCGGARAAGRSGLHRPAVRRWPVAGRAGPAAAAPGRRCLAVPGIAGRPRVLPPDWLLHREGGTREVRFALYRRATATL